MYVPTQTGVVGAIKCIVGEDKRVTKIVGPYLVGGLLSVYCDGVTRTERVFGLLIVEHMAILIVYFDPIGVGPHLIIGWGFLLALLPGDVGAEDTHCYCVISDALQGQIYSC